MDRPDDPTETGRPVGSRAEPPSIERVVVPMQLDEHHEAAARWAAALGGAVGARTLYLVPDRFASSERPPYRREIEASGTVDEARRWLASIDVHPDQVEMIVGDPADGVDDAVDEHAVVVIGTDDVAGVTPLALGATSRSLASRLDCPVVAVPSSARGSDGPVVVGASGRSEDELRTLGWATAVAASLDRPVVAVHAVESGDVGADGASDDDRAARRMAQDMGVAYMNQPGDPVDVCRAVADQLGASLLVVSAKHRRSLGGRLLGGVADALVHEPPVPVAVVTHGYTDT